MKRFMSKKVAAIGLAVGVTLGAGGAAFAYFTSSATGTGAATAGESVTLTNDIVQTNTITGLVPSGAAVAVAYKITNPSTSAENLGVVSITGITVTLAGAGAAAHTANSALTCDSSDFVVTAGASAVGTVVNGAPFISGAGNQPTIQMKESGTNQDACQDASLSLTLNAAQGA